MTDPSCAVIVDIVDSRLLTDRAAAQRAVLDTFAQVARVVAFRRPLWATVGDEFQAVLPDVDAALAATTLARLLLPEGLDCRVGIGRGEVRELGVGDEPVIHDGPGWWNARAAIEEAHRREDGPAPWLRSWYASGDDAEGAPVVAFLLLRDNLIGRMRGRDRRIAAGALLGRPQTEIARAEGVTQSAVSQNLQRSGAGALAAAHAALTGARTR